MLRAVFFSVSLRKHKRTSKASLKKRKLTRSTDAPPLNALLTPSSAVVSVHQPGTAELQRSRRWYRQKYASHWDGAQEFADWLTRAPADPNTAYCLACAKSLFGGMAHLRRHALTPYHKKRMVETQKVGLQLDVWLGDVVEELLIRVIVIRVMVENLFANNLKYHQSIIT